MRTELEIARSAVERREAVEGARASWERHLDEALRRVADRAEALGTAREERDALWARAEAQERERAALEAEREALNAEAQERARAECEAERRALQANWDLEREALAGQVEQRVRMAEECAEAEHRAWREQAEAARLRAQREREVLQGVLDRLQQEIDPLRGERETTRTLIDSLTREREHLTTFRDQLKASFQEREKVYQSRLTEISQALQQANQEKAALRRLGNELVGQVRELRGQVDRQPQIHDGEHRRSLPFMAPRLQGSTINPPAEADLPVAETEVALAIAHTDLALSQLGSFLDHRR
jgi:chromosome segregation ATPase